MSQDFWRLPKGVDEVLPPRARYLELLRRRVLDLFDVWGYDYIEPPIIEYLDALLVGNDLNLQTLQVADQVSGRTLGVRADITAQAARIDANSLSRGGAKRDNSTRSGGVNGVGEVGDGSIRRLCYAGPVVRANPKGVLESRVPLKAGAEIYGCAGVEADLEIMCLAIDALRAAGLDVVVIELGHVGFVRQLVDELELPDKARARLLEAVRIKSEADILAILEKALGAAPSAADHYGVAAERLCRLVRLMGDAAALDHARALFSPEATSAASAQRLGMKLLELVDQLDYCAARLQALRPDVVVRFDLSAPVGFGYHHALVFALYDPGHGRAVARGGRYDGIGEQFGDARPATGFDLNLKTLLGLPAVIQRAEAAPRTAAVWVPHVAKPETDRAVASAEQQPGLAEAIAQLRAEGVRVVQALSEDDIRPDDCDRQLQHNGNRWQAI